MRRPVLATCFLILVAAMLGLWAIRFEKQPSLRSWDLADLRAANPEIPGLEWSGTQENPRLKVVVSPDHPRVGARLRIPDCPAVDFLYLDFRMAAQALVPGAELWADGRFMIEWHYPGMPDPPQMDPAGSIRYDGPAMRQRIVLHPAEGRAVPAIRLEHLGRSGSFEIQHLKIRALRESRAWKLGAPLLALAWASWFFAWFRPRKQIRAWRAAGAAVVMLLMGVNFVLPGPWKIIRPIGGDFHLGAEARVDPAANPSHAGDMPHPSIISGPIPTVGKLPDQGSLVLRIKLRIKEARPLLHALMMFGPTLLLGILVGRSAALRASILLALAIEAAQMAFGYGFGWDDVGDLFCNAIGIFAAVVCLSKLDQWLGRKKQKAGS